MKSQFGPTQYRMVEKEENHAVLEQSRIIAVFVETGNSFGLMMCGERFLTREEQAALIQAAQDSPIRD